MNDLDNFELNDQEMGERSGSSLEPPEQRGPNRLMVVIVAVVAVLTIVAGYWFWMRGDEQEVAATAPDTATSAESEVVIEGTEREVEPLELPELDASDVVVRELAAVLSANPEFAAWLINDDLVRRFVVAIDNVAEGQTPRTHLGFMAPKKGFRTWEAEGALHISPTSYRRYDPVTEAFVSLDTAGSIELFHRLEPLAQQAYRELGYPNRSFEDVVRRAAQIVLATPQADGPLQLEAAVRSYKFADPALERLDPVQKQLLRFGPRNVSKIQQKVRAFLQALDAQQ